jgi:hypothetical protein
MEEIDFFRRGFGSSFLQALISVPEHRPVAIDAARIEASARAIIGKHRHELPPSTSPDVLAYAATLIAAYDELVARGDDHQAALQRLAEAQRAGSRFVTERTRAGLDAAPDPFALIRDASKEREERFFGAAFSFERPRDDGDAYHLEILACEFVRLARAEGVPHLAPLFCEFDAAWIAAIDPAKHRLRFARPTTIAAGCDRCRFYFDRQRDA